ncbi:MAG: ABC transporter substrate-binding protein, partial [Euryarchaeota archaeon]|nr:ABC transporter substrate-binding protein [Euryarchaeota archaeon]
MRMLTVAHSPDADDAFMFYAMVSGRLDCGFEVREVHADIETLNRLALQGKYELTAISVHAYPYVAERYVLLTCGSSMGLGYGPVVVSRGELESLAGRRVAIPGKLTTAALLLRLYEQNCSTVEMSFERIPEAV